MAKKENAPTAADQNPEGENFDATKMLTENGAKGTVIRYTDRMKIELIKDTMYQKKGKVYSPAKVKALAMIQQGLAKEVK